MRGPSFWRNPSSRPEHRTIDARDPGTGAIRCEIRHWSNRQDHQDRNHSPAAVAPYPAFAQISKMHRSLFQQGQRRGHVKRAAHPDDHRRRRLQPSASPSSRRSTIPVESDEVLLIFGGVGTPTDGAVHEVSEFMEGAATVPSWAQPFRKNHIKLLRRQFAGIGEIGWKPTTIISNMYPASISGVVDPARPRFFDRRDLKPIPEGRRPIIG